MVIGLFVYLAGQKYLAKDALTIKKETLQETPAAVSAPLSRNEWERVGALVFLCLLNVVFWAVYEQQGNTMQTWADEKTVWPVLLGFQVPSTWFQSFNPFFIFMFAPLLDMFWGWQRRHGREPSTVAKMGIGCILVGVSFIVMMAGAAAVGTEKGSIFWLTACTLLLTVGELYLSPIGLSLVTKVSPARIVSLMMGMWFLSSAVGNTVSGYLGALYSQISNQAFFGLLTVLGIVTGLLIFASAGFVKRLIGEEHA